MACTGPIFRRMIVVPLHNTITCGESMGTPDDEDDNFCKKALSSVVKFCSSLDLLTPIPGFFIDPEPIQCVVVDLDPARFLYVDSRHVAAFADTGY